MRGGWERGGVSTPGGTLGAQRIRRECTQYFPSPLGPQEACWAPGPGLPFSGAPSGLVHPRSMGGRRSKRRRGGWGRPSGTRESGEALWAFPPCTQLQEACWAPGSGPMPSGAPSGHMSPRGIEGFGGKKKRGQWEGTLQEWITGGKCA